MIISLRQLREKCVEQQMDLYVMFVDLKKAFDTFSGEGLWKLLSAIGFPEQFVIMARQFHDDMVARVMENEDQSKPFPVRNGVKPGCVLAPTLFSILFAAMFTYG